MRSIELRDASIHYDFIQGNSSCDKSTIVFLHGLGLDQTTWQFLIPHFVGYELLTFDLRWHGNSSGVFYNSDEANWKALIHDFLALIDETGVKNYHLVTHGIGTQLSVEMIIRDIISPKTVTVLSTPFYYPKLVAEKGIAYRAEKIKDMTGGELGEWMIPQILVTTDPFKHETIKNAFEKVQIDLYLDILRLNAKAISLEKLTKVGVPALLLNGEFDVNYPPSLTTVSSNYLPHCRVKIVGNASNMVQIDQPENTAAFIKEFIQESNLMLSQQKKANELNLPYLHLLYAETKGSKDLFIRIDFLTVFHMSVNGIEIHGKWNRRKAKDLIAYLAYYGKSSKERIYDALWPGSNIRNVQNSLRVSLHHLRSMLKEAGLTDLVLSDSNYIWLNKNIEIQCDVKEAFNGKLELPSPNLLFSDLPADWTLQIQYELENKVSVPE